MVRVSRTILSFVLLAMLGCAALMVLASMQSSAEGSVAAATTRAYPGPAPCNTSLQACVSASAHGDSIVISASTYITSVTITRAVNLFGSAAGGITTTLSAPVGAQRAITVDGSSITRTWSISNLVLQNGNANTLWGGAIRIENSSQPPRIHNVVFSNNIGFLFGGAIAYNGGGVLHVSNSVFYNNITAHDGGAIWTGGAVFVTNTVFESNDAGGSGGAIRALGNVALSNTRFLRNTAIGDGGAIQSFGNLNDSSGFYDGNMSAAAGGAVNALRVNLKQAYFSLNIAGLNGGAVSTGGAITDDSGIYYNNVSQRDGGALYGTANMVLTDTYLSFNSAANGGAIAAAASLTMTRGYVILNHAISATQPSFGGGVVAQNIWMTGTNVSNNSVLGLGAFGGGLAATQRAELINVEIAFNHAVAQNGSMGGGIFAESFLTLTNTQVYGNEASYGCGARTGLLANVMINAGEFRQNNSSLCSDGGALNLPGGTVTISGTRFVQNAASYRGGAIYSSADLTMTGTAFISNTATGSSSIGGAIAAPFGNVNIARSRFISNSAFVAGAISTSDFTGGSVRIENSLFARNRSNRGAADVDAFLVGPLSLLHNTFADADRINPSPAIYLSTTVAGTPVVTIANNIITSHTVGLFATSGITGPQPVGNLLWNVSLPVSGSLGPIRLNNKYGNPAFLNPATDDYHLGMGSAAVWEARFLGVMDDFDGDNRPLTYTSGYPDIGFDQSNLQPPEVAVHTFLDTNRNGTLNAGEPAFANVAITFTTTIPWPYPPIGNLRYIQSGPTQTNGQLLLMSSSGVLSHSLTVNAPSGYAATSSNVFTFATSTGEPPMLFRVGFTRLLDRRITLPAVLR